MRFLLFVVLSLVAVTASPQSAVDAARRGIAAVQAVLQKRPDDPTLYFYLARFQAEAGDTDAAIASLGKVAALGEGFLPSRENGFDRIWGDPRFQDARRALEAKLPRLDFAPIAFELDDARLVPEGIAYDPLDHVFFLSSLHKRKIVRVRPRTANQGSSATLADPPSEGQVSCRATRACRHALPSAQKTGISKASKK